MHASYFQARVRFGRSVRSLGILLCWATAALNAVNLVYLMMFSVWGGPSPFLYAIPLAGAAALALGAVGLTSGSQRLILIALGGCVALWSFYGPALFGVVLAKAEDRRLHVVIFRHTSGSQAAAVVRSPQISVPDGELNKALGALQGLGATGEIMPVAAQEFGRGTKTVALLIISHVPATTVQLQQPKTDEIVYLQDIRNGDRWQSYLTTAKLFQRTITLKALPGRPGSVLVTVGLSDGSSRGFEVCCWPSEPNTKP